MQLEQRKGIWVSYKLARAPKPGGNLRSDTCVIQACNWEYGYFCYRFCSVWYVADSRKICAKLHFIRITLYWQKA